MISPNVGDLPPVTQYLGVPYGVAPSGQYRFNMAISAAKWTHMPKDAYSLSSVCIQSGIPELAEAKALKTTSAQRYDHMHKLLPKLKPQSEDCLHMNLYVPERMTYHTDLNRKKLPVLVVVHGDEYGWNSGNPYNGTILASYGQIIVITLNYRLGVFGFLGRCESSSCSGNSGLSDLVAALKMLTNILPAFGGDPNLITLLGWGSGASLVSLLMASPITQPNNRLFQRAILLDGSALAPWAMSKNPQPIFFQLAEHLKEHHFLPNHFKRDSFFGTVRPYASYANEPFPPPPLPPTPLPKFIEKLTTLSSRETNSDRPSTTPVPLVKASQNSTMLSITVAVGCGLLFLNICIGLGLYRQCNKKEETKKKLQLQYQTYSANYQLNATDVNYINNVAGNQQLNYMPLPPPPTLSQRPSITNSMTAPLDSTSSKTNEFESGRTGSYQNYNDATHNDALITKCNHFQEQEPLLSTTGKTAIGSSAIGSLRVGISPTCPKHGRAAMAQASGKAVSLSGLSAGGHALEEIQV
ncbi:Carboxylesterase [Onchocerca flexuosa]|uniref:Carboxylesterase n=1 Tax=Onchocerca flexuosa TaxID=387005 RepID=A0A238BQG4_9BILA|nr:Carboxylesterase [Onchocerca flexuosa]